MELYNTNSGLRGGAVKDSNFILRLCLILFSGTMLLGVIVAWRTQLLVTSEYQELPATHSQMKIKKKNELVQSKFLQTILPNDVPQ